MKLHFSIRPFPASAISNIGASSLQNKAVTLGSASGLTAESTMKSADPFTRDVASILSMAAQNAPQAQAKRLNDMQDALTKIRAMPSDNVSAKSAATERAAMLKKILDMLKQMMAGATPAQAKAMAGQLKEIARELAAMGKLLSGGGSAATVTKNPASDSTGMTDTGTGDTLSDGADASIQVSTVEPGATASTAPTGADVAAPAVSNAPTSQTTTAETPNVAGTSAIAEPTTSVSQLNNARQAVAAYTAEATRNTQDAGNNGGEKSVNDGLRKMLQEALKALRALIAIFKSKLGASSKELKEAESKILELARSLADAGNQHNSLTDAQGSLPEQIAQYSVQAEAVVDPVTDSVDTAGDIGSEISFGDTGETVGGNISVSV